MFSQESFIEAKVFLKSYADAIETIKEAAWKTEHIKKYEKNMERILELQEQNQVKVNKDKITPTENFKNSREVKLFQFSNYVFKKYLPGFDSYRGDYVGLKQMLNEATERIKQDLEVAASASQ